MAEQASWAYVGVVAAVLVLLLVATGIFVHVWRWRP